MKFCLFFYKPLIKAIMWLGMIVKIEESIKRKLARKIGIYFVDLRDVFDVTHTVFRVVEKRNLNIDEIDIH